MHGAESDEIDSALFINISPCLIVTVVHSAMPTAVKGYKSNAI
jgi:hypothetical protein